MLRLTETVALLLLLHMPLLNCMKNELYKTHRLEKLCKTEGGKVGIVINDVVSTFSLNSSLIPAGNFNCHIELVVRSSDTGFFVFFEEMLLSEPSISGCNEDYIQFGRDILFVTSHVSKKYCGRMDKVILSHCDKNKTDVTMFQLGDRIYSEDRDRDMDIWIRVKIPPSSNNYKYFTLVITPFKKSCSPHDPQYRKCGSSRCIRKELFCDGKVNCAMADSSPEDEKNCNFLAVDDKAGSTWFYGDSPVMEVLALVCLLTAIVSGYSWYRHRRRKIRQKKGGSDRLPAVDEHHHARGEQSDLIDFGGELLYHQAAAAQGVAEQRAAAAGHIVPVSVPSCPPLPPPPPYSQIGSHSIVPQYSYTNR